jgi:hypothetical protein
MSPCQIQQIEAVAVPGMRIGAIATEVGGQQRSAFASILSDRA